MLQEKKYSKSSFKMRRWQRYCLNNLTPFSFSLYTRTPMIQALRRYDRFDSNGASGIFPLLPPPYSRVKRVPLCACQYSWSSSVHEILGILTLKGQPPPRYLPTDSACIHVVTGFLLVMLCIRPFAKTSEIENMVESKGILKVSRLVQNYFYKVSKKLRMKCRSQ